MDTAHDILVVEDNRQNYELVEFLLTEAGLKVRRARDAEQLYQEMQCKVPSIVLMDIELPGADGLSLLRDLRQDPAFNGLTIIALTAHALPGDRQRFLRQGCDGYLAKPIDVASFVDEVRAYL